MNKLIALLPCDSPPGPQQLHGWQCSADGRVQVVAMGVADIAQAKAAQVLVVVPQVCLSWHRVTLPATVRLKGDARLQPVLQNLLEEVLLDDAELMHLALAPQAQPGQPCIVASCSKAWLGAWLQTLESAGIKVAQVLPQVAPDVLGDSALAIEHAHSAWLVLPQDGLPVCVPANSEMQALNQLSQCLTLPSTFNEITRSLGAEKVQLASEQQYVQQMLQTRWDLAQHGFASQTADRLRRKLQGVWQEVMYAPSWRAARWAVASLAVVTVLGLNAQWWWQHRLLSQKRDAVLATAQSAFPHLRVVVDAPLQMQREIDRLRQSAGLLAPSDLQPMAAAAGAALQASGLLASQVSYAAGELLLQGRGLTEQLVPALNEQLQQRHYQAEWIGDAIRIKVQP